MNCVVKHGNKPLYWEPSNILLEFNHLSTGFINIDSIYEKRLES